MTRIDIKAILRHPKLRAELLPSAVDFICRVERIRQSPSGRPPPPRQTVDDDDHFKAVGFYPGLEIIAKLATVLEVQPAELLRPPDRRGSRRPTLTDRSRVIPPPETIFDREPWEPKVLELKTGGSSAYWCAVAEQVKPVAVLSSLKAAVRILKGLEHNDR